MSFLKRIFKSNSSPAKLVLSNDFTDHVAKAIQLIGNVSGETTDAEIIKLLKFNGIPTTDAIEILIFLPIAFCRRLLPDVSWKDTYDEIISNSTTEKTYLETESYCKILRVTEEFYSNRPDKNVIIKIAGRSAEFNAINNLLNDGGTLNEVELTKTVIIRPS